MIDILFVLLIMTVLLFSYMVYRFLLAIAQFNAVLTKGIESITENASLSTKALETAQRVKLLESQINILDNTNEDLRRERDYLKESLRDKTSGQSESK